MKTKIKVIIVFALGIILLSCMTIPDNRGGTIIPADWEPRDITSEYEGRKYTIPAVELDMFIVQ